MELTKYTADSIDKWLAIWAATQVALARSEHLYIKDETNNIIVDAERILIWLKSERTI